MKSMEFHHFKSNMDSWIKEFRRDLNNHATVLPLVEEHEENIEHNYELLQQMRAEINKLKEELQALRLVQILHLKSEIERTRKH